MSRRLNNICGQVDFDKGSFESAIQSVADDLSKDPHHRLYSWDHSHAVWKGFVGGRVSTDHATLNLAFYLASWGMYRGSSDLLFRDYKVLTPAVEYLKKEANETLEDCAFSQEDPGQLAGRIVEISTALMSKLIPKLTRPDVRDHNPKPTDTLLSKILLNTLACVPAFDTEVKKALSDILPGYTDGNAFRRPVLRACIELARQNRDLIVTGQQHLQSKAKVCYPLTKVLDLYLWIYASTLKTKQSS